MRTDYNYRVVLNVYPALFEKDAYYYKNGYCGDGSRVIG